ncbi:MAG: PilZ domain-containing protein [Planctomycetes bacterium]|nr:PilZ domain-containing protein [Planctomycetota bacterium]
MIKSTGTDSTTSADRRTESGKITAQQQCASPQRVIELLTKRFGEKRDAPNQRSSERHPWVVDISLVIEDPHGKPRTLDVVTHDISEGGFSFMYQQFIHVGTRIITHFGSIPGHPSLVGVVRNCVYVGSMYHRIGVQFPTASKAPKNQTDTKPL